MPITKITIQNFKGVQECVEIPIRPITLLFGANSAGKSTILQAMLYFRDLLERGNVDADRLAVAGTTLDLGGFREFVHGRDLIKKVTIGISLRLDSDGLPEPRHIRHSDLPDLNLTSPEIDSVEEVTVRLTAEWSHSHNQPFITSYAVNLDGIHFATIHAQPGQVAHLDLINPDHPVFSTNKDGSSTEPEEVTNLFGALQCHYLDKDGATKTEELTKDPDKRQRLIVGDRAIPDFHHGLPEEWSAPPDQEEEAIWQAAWLHTILNRTVVGAGSLILSELQKIRYIGPIRRIPERNFQAQHSPAADRWADGSAAWDLITSGVDHAWLNERAIQVLGLGLSIQQRSHYEIPTESGLGYFLTHLRNARAHGIVDERMVDMLDNIDISNLNLKSRTKLVSDETGIELSPSDVGVGISQALPVAIGAMAPGYSVMAVEQPELHIHPAIQCNLGDLIASQVVHDDSRTILLETHSEHLILRMLKRIREKSEGELSEDAPPLRPSHLSVLWVEQSEGVVSIKPITVNTDGDFDEPWPKGFFEERFYEYE